MKSASIQKALIAGFALLAVAGYLMTTVESLGQTGFDDAYMVTRYAKHFLAGEGFSWNPGDGPAYGVTSPAYLVVITAIMGLTGCSDATALTLTSFWAGLLSVAALALLGFIVQADKWSKKSWIPLLVVPCLLLPPAFRYHSLTGMETTLSLLANALLACSIVLASRRRTTTALLMCLLSGLLSCATRPDNGLYAFLLPPLFFVATDRAMWRYAVRYAVLFAVLVACSLIANRYVFGDFLPLPFYAKANGFYEGYIGAGKWNAMREMLRLSIAALPCLVVIVGTTTKRTLPQVLAIAIVITATFAYYATVTQIMGWQARYYYPSLAFVFLAAFTAAFPAADEAHKRASHGAVGIRFLLGLVVLMPALSDRPQAVAAEMWENHVIGNPSAIRSVTQYRTAKDDALPGLGWWNSITAMSALLERMPPGTIIAASEHGFLGSRFPDVTIIDLVGLHDRTIAHRGFSVAYVLSREPDVIWFPHRDYTRAVADIRDDVVFQHDYEYYPGAYDYGIALRRSSGRYPGMSDVAKSEFSRIYPGRVMSDYLAEPVAPPDKE